MSGMIESHYSVNIAKATGRQNWNRTGLEYRHFCRVDAGKYSDPQGAKEVVEKLMESFPAPQFEIRVTLVKCVGVSTTAEEFVTVGFPPEAMSL